MDSLGFSIIAKTGKQQQIKIPISGREVLQPFTWYTCPTGQRAIVKGRVQCTGRGAAAVANFVANEIMFQWDRNTQPPLGDYLDTPRSLSDVNGGQFGLFDIELAAGETIVTSQDSGTNAEFNLWMEVEELPV